jgi:hypothetical protein
MALTVGNPEDFFEIPHHRNMKTVILKILLHLKLRRICGATKI